MILLEKKNIKTEKRKKIVIAAISFLTLCTIYVDYF